MAIYIYIYIYIYNIIYIYRYILSMARHLALQLLDFVEVFLVLLGAVGQVFERAAAAVGRVLPVLGLE